MNNYIKFRMLNLKGINREFIGTARNRSAVCDDGRFISPKECRRL